jgi:hypothetical protein
MKRLLPLFCIIVFLFVLRLSNLSIRLSDTNIYFYTAYELLQGKLLYRDIFFTNFPLFPYISAVYLFFSNKHILFYYLTPTIEISITALLIYYIVYKKTKMYGTALFSFLLYILSFMVLSTSEHQTGVFLASLFAVLAYLFWNKKSYIVTGIFLGLTLLTKAYFLPIILSFLLTMLLQKNYNGLIKTGLSFTFSILLLLSPFLLLAKDAIYTDIITYSLTRLAGVSKIDIFWFFVTHELLFFVLLLFNLFNFKKQIFFGCVSLFSILFFFFYADSYYLYFNFFIPFLCLSLPLFLEFLKKQLHVQKFIFPTILFICLAISLTTYLGYYKDLGKMNNTSSVVQTIKKHKPAVLYGVNDSTPALAYLSNTPLLNGIVDTNESIFRKHFLNADELTKDAIKQNAMIITHGVFYPQADIDENILDEIFNKDVVKKHCTLIQSFPVLTEGITNQLNLFQCQENL